MHASAPPLERRKSRRVAFIGLGAMGAPMARHVSEVLGVELVVYDLAPSAMESASAFGTPATSLDAAVRDADVVITMLPADEHVRDVAKTVGESAAAGTVFIDLSTIMPTTMVAIAHDDAPQAIMLSGSCMKSVAAARSGDLTIFLGGDSDAIDANMDVLGSMASVVLPVEGVQGPKSLKIVNNLITASLNYVIAEAAVLGLHVGVPYRALARALARAGVGGWTLHNHFIKHTLTGDLGPGHFSTAYMRKDVRLAARLADQGGRSRLLVGTLLAAYRGTIGLGMGDDFHPSIIRWLETTATARPLEVGHRQIDEVTSLLVAWVQTAERVIATHGCALAHDFGLSPTAAAQLLSRASADNSSVQDIASSSTHAWWPKGQASAPEILGRALELADNARVPATGIEVLGEFIRREFTPTLTAMTSAEQGEK